MDLLHEFELGVWKSLFTHLIRILYAAAPGGGLVTMLDERYEDFSSLYMLQPTRILQISPNIAFWLDHPALHY